VPVMTQVQAKKKGAVGNVNTVSVLSKALQNPVKSGMEAPNGYCESNGNGHASLHEGFDL
jgi:hypothetical protein